MPENFYTILLIVGVTLIAGGLIALAALKKNDTFNQHFRNKKK